MVQDRGEGPSTLGACVSIGTNTFELGRSSISLEFGIHRRRFPNRWLKERVCGSGPGSAYGVFAGIGWSNAPLSAVLTPDQL